MTELCVINGALRVQEKAPSCGAPRYTQLKEYKQCKVALVRDGVRKILRVWPSFSRDRSTDILLVGSAVNAHGQQQTLFLKLPCGRNVQMRELKDGKVFADAINDLVNTRINPQNGTHVTPLAAVHRGPATSTPRGTSQVSPFRERGTESARRELGTSPLFTHVKRRSSEIDERKASDMLFCDERDTENVLAWPRSEMKKPKPDFLSAASEKSKSLENLATSSFYNKQPGRSYGMFGNKSSSVGVPNKSYSRRPGMLPFNPEKSQKKIENLDNNHRYSWTTPKSSPLVTKDPQSLKGFSNLGNTCYMNAILQALFGLDPFSRDLQYLATQAKHTKIKNYTNALYFVLARLHNAAIKKVNKDKEKQYLEDVKKSISTSAMRFSGYEQHDAHEFLSQVIDQVKEDILKENKHQHKQKAENQDHKSPDKEGNPDITCDPSEDHDILKDPVINPSMLNFEFQIMHIITCLQCKQEVKKIERFNDLSIDMPKRMSVDEVSTLQNALDQFFAKEEIEYRCEACNHKRVQVAHTFYKAPRVIILHLKRYHFNSTVSVNKKVGRNIKIAKYLTLWGHANQQTIPPYPDDIRLAYNLGFQQGALTEDENFNNISNSEVSEEKFSSFKFKRTENIGKQEEFSSPLRRSALKGRDTNTESDFNRVLEQSKKQTKNPDLDRVIEQSRRESEVRNKYAELTKGLSEEDQMKLALEQSMQDSVVEGAGAEEEEASQEQIKLAMEQSLQDSRLAEGYNNCENDWPMDIPVDDLEFNDEEQQQTAKNDVIDLTTSSHDNKLKQHNVVTSPPPRKSHHLGGNYLNLNNNNGDSDDIDESGYQSRAASPIVFDGSTTKTTNSNIRQKSGGNLGGNIFEAHDNFSHGYGVEDHDSNGHDGADHGYNNTDNVNNGKGVSGRNDSDSSLCEKMETSLSSNSINEPSTKKLKFCSNSEEREEYDRNMNDKKSELISEMFDRLDDTKLTPEKKNGSFHGTPKRLDDLFSKASSTSAVRNADMDALEGDFGGQMGADFADDGGDSKTWKNPNPSLYSALSSDEDNEVLIRRDDVTFKKKRGGDIDFNQENNSDEVVKSDTPDWISEAKAKQEQDSKYSPIVIQPLSYTENHADEGKSEDWISEAKTKQEQEETDLKRALEISLLDQSTTMTSKEADEELRKAIELSLKDFEATGGAEVPEEESFLTEQPADLSEEDIKRRHDNQETGDMPYSYRLVSVVSHLGTSAAGHYISDVLNLEKECWYSYDDSEVSRLSEDCVRQNRERSGYIFFYMHTDFLAESKKSRKPSLSKENDPSLVHNSNSKELGNTPTGKVKPLSTLSNSPRTLDNMFNKRTVFR